MVNMLYKRVYRIIVSKKASMKGLQSNKRLKRHEQKQIRRKKNVILIWEGKHETRASIFSVSSLWIYFYTRSTNQRRVEMVAKKGK